MSLALLLALQSMPAALPPLPMIDFDLAHVKPADPCERGASATDIVVCGRRPSGTFDLEKWERIFRPERFVAETPLGRGAVARAYTESVGMNAGNISKRAMVGIRIGF